MLSTAMLTTMFDYNSARNQRILACATNLSDAQLDAPTDYGIGSIRKTLWHIMIVEYGWRSFGQAIDARQLPSAIEPTATIAEFQAFRLEESELGRSYG